MKSRATFRVVLVLWGLLAGTLALAQGGGVKTGYAPVNGLRMYYEIHSYEEHGGGIPLIVLHGGIGSADMFGEIMPASSARRQVIAVDWTTEVAGIKAPTLLVFGDADAVRTAHAVEFFELLGGGKKDAGWDGSGMSNARLAILPGVSHYSIMTQPALATVATQFLDAPMSRTN